MKFIIEVSNVKEGMTPEKLAELLFEELVESNVGCMIVTIDTVTPA